MHLTIPQIQYTVVKYRPEELWMNILLIGIIHVIEHESKLPIRVRIGCDRFSSLPRFEMCREFPSTEIRLMVTLSLFQTSAHNITEFPCIVSRCCFFGQHKVCVNHISNILKYHGCTLLNTVLCTDEQICVAA